MRKFILAVVFCSMVSVANADVIKLSEYLDKLPPMKQGIAFSLADSKLNYLSTIEIAKWKFLSLEGGYAGAAENSGNKVVAVLSTNIANAKKLGIEIPIVDLLDVNVGFYAGYGSINGVALGDSELDYGISATLLTLKW